MLLLLDLSGALTAAFLTLLAVLKFSEVAPALEGPCRVGLLASGLGWICLVLWDSSRSPVALWAYPPLLFLALFGPRLLKTLRRGIEDWKIRRQGNWRCPSCGKENEAISPVCYYCQSWRKKS